MTTRGRRSDCDSAIEKRTSFDDPGTSGVGRQQVVHAPQHSAPVLGPDRNGNPRQVVGGGKSQNERALGKPHLDGYRSMQRGSPPT